MKDQIDLFAQRGKVEIKDFALLYVLVSILLMFNFIGALDSTGNELTNITLYIIIISLILLLVLFIILMNQIRTWKLVKDKEKFTNTELRRIEREAKKGPKMQNVLVTHDVIAYRFMTCTCLIPVKDIVWMKEILLLSLSRKVLMIVTRDKARHFISIERMDKNSYRYLLQMVREIRPGAIIQKITDRLSPTQKSFIEKIIKADSVGTKDPADLEMLYDQKKLYETWPSEVIDERRIEKRLIFFTFFMYLIAYLLYHYSYYFLKHSDPIKQELLNRIWRNYGIGFLVTVPFIVFIIYFFRYLIYDQKRYMSKISRVSYVFFGIIPMGVFICVVLFLNDDERGSEAIQQWKQYEAGTLDIETFMQSIIPAYSEEGDYWKYGDVTYPKHREIYGYDKLTKKEQKIFDLLYSEIMKDEIVVFDLPEKISNSSFEKAVDLYECNHRFNPFRYYRYMQRSTSSAKAERIGYDWTRIYSEDYQRKVQGIVAMVPAELDDQQKLKWIVDYLLENIEIYQMEHRNDSRKDTELDDWGMDVKEKITTGYGALKLHTATEKGYMEAFGMIAEKAGIYTIAVMDDENKHYWNLLQVDDQWKAINLYQMDLNLEQEEQYYLVSNSEMERLLNAKGTYGLNKFIDLPE